MNVDYMHTLEGLGVALLAGLIIGVERSWQSRSRSSGEVMLGIRTVGLIGFLGGLSGLLFETVGPAVVAVSIAVVGSLLVANHILSTFRSEQEMGATTEVASMIAFVLGIVSVLVDVRITAAGAVLTVAILGFKTRIHQWVNQISEDEMLASLKLLLITLVVLPLLPNEGYGPWGTLNPYELWWMVVLIAGISYLGYVGVRIFGAKLGVGATGILGGLASSTAATLSFSRMARTHKSLQTLLAAGVVISCATMFPRIFLEVGVVNANLLPGLIWPVGLMTVTGYAGAFWLWYSVKQPSFQGDNIVKNPFELSPALKFGLLLALIMMLTRAMEFWFGGAGIYAASAISGVSDVDAITLSLSRMARDGLESNIARNGIIIAAIINTMTKAGMAVILGRGKMGLKTAIVLGLSVLMGAAGVVIDNLYGSPDLGISWMTHGPF